EQARTGTDVGDPRARLDAQRLDDLVRAALGIEARLLARVVVLARRPRAAGRLSLGMVTTACRHDQQAQHHRAHMTSVAENRRARPRRAGQPRVIPPGTEKTKAGAHREWAPAPPGVLLRGPSGYRSYWRS